MATCRAFWGAKEMKLIEMAMCRHSYEFQRKLYGDEINIHDGKRFEYKCSKCGKYKWTTKNKISKCNFFNLKGCRFPVVLFYNCMQRKDNNKKMQTATEDNDFDKFMSSLENAGILKGWSTFMSKPAKQQNKINSDNRKDNYE